MGNVLQTVQDGKRLASLVHRHESDELVAELSKAQEPALSRVLSVTHSKLKGTIWHYAADTGNAELLQGLIRLVGERSSGTSRQQAIETLTRLLNQAYDFNVTPLMMACSQGCESVVRMLMEHGADPTAGDLRGRNNCLHVSAAKGHACVIEVLLHTEASFPLISHSVSNSSQVSGQATETLTGSNGPAVDAAGQEPAPIAGSAAGSAAPAARAGTQAEAVRIGFVTDVSEMPLVNQGLLDTETLHGLTALHLAICYRRRQAIDVLLKAGASMHVSTMFETTVGNVTLPRASSALHAAVLARDQDAAIMLLVEHWRRHAGTTAGRYRDPRLLQNRHRQLPYHVATWLRLPSEFCQLMHPFSSLHEQLQVWAPAALSVMVHLPSLQEAAAGQLRQNLSTQAKLLAAAVQFVKPSTGKAALLPADQLQDAARELLLLLYKSPIVCVSISPKESLCMQLNAQAGHMHQPHAPAPPLSTQAVLDLVRYYIMCNGVCEPSQPERCAFADACNTCDALATAAPFSHHINGQDDSGDNCSRATCASTEYEESVNSCHGTPQPSCCQAEAPSIMSTAGSSSATVKQVAARNAVSGLSCKIMPSPACLSTPQAAVLDNQKLLGMLQAMQSMCAKRWDALLNNESVDNECGVCFEDETQLLLRLQPCKHTLCLSCVNVMIQLITARPVQCPFCRANISGLTMHVPVAAS